MAIYAKITIEKGGMQKKEYLALLNTGAGLKPLPTGDVLLIPFIIVPPEVAKEINISNYEELSKIGEYYIAEDTYIVCLYDPEDKVVVCKECFVLVRPTENRILISFEFLASADIVIDPRKRCWIYRPENKEIDDFFKVKNFRCLPKHLLRFTPYYDYV